MSYFYAARTIQGPVSAPSDFTTKYHVVKPAHRAGHVTTFVKGPVANMAERDAIAAEWEEIKRRGENYDR